MEEARDPKSSVNVSDDAGSERHNASRNDEATSETTLSELEESQKSSEGRGKATTGGDTSTVTPSPDGAFDEKGGGRADGSDTGGPM